MNTSLVELPGRRTRRRHPTDFKQRIVQACQQPGVSIASVAVANGLNPNMVRKWLIEAEAGAPPEVSAKDRVPAPTVCAQAGSPSMPSFIPVRPDSTTSPASINVEINRGLTSIKVFWPASASADCAVWLRELLR